MPFPTSEVGKTYESTNGQYQIVRLHKASSRAAVFEAVTLPANMRVAIKVIAPELITDDGERQRFLRVMQLLTDAKLSHKNIVRMQSAFVSNTTCWMVMDYIDGPSAAEFLPNAAAGRMDWRDAWCLANDIASALEYISQKGMIHRNVVPTNILRKSNPSTVPGNRHTWLLTDLLFAKATGRENAQPITAPGQILGELPFIAPERTYPDLRAVDIRADIYGLGMTLYSLVSGELPFTEMTQEGLLSEIRSNDELRSKIRANQLSVRPAFEEAILKMVRKRPGDRYQSGTELLKALNAIYQSHRMDFPNPIV
jgi:serine/threonine-protein kinase